MNAKTRTARATLRQRSAATRTAARITRLGDATLTSHAIAAGLTPRQARTVAGALRNAAHNLDIPGRTVDMHVKWRTHSRQTGLVTAHRYTRADVARMAAQYRPRIAAYRTARQHLLLAA